MKPREVMTRKRFLAWLRSKNPDERVGLPGDNRGCPIATYTRENGFTETCVGYEDWDPRPEDCAIFLPPWAKKFIKEIDGLPPLCTIRAAQALVVLETGKLPPELAVLVKS